MLFILCCSADLPHSYGCVPLWAEEIENFDNVGKLLDPLVGLRSKAVNTNLINFRIHLFRWCFDSFVIKKAG